MNQLTPRQINTIKVLAEFDNFSFQKTSPIIYASDMPEYLTDLNKLAGIYGEVMAKILIASKLKRERAYKSLPIKWEEAWISQEKAEELAHLLAKTITELQEDKK